MQCNENKHWEETHCYLLLGTERSVERIRKLHIEKVLPAHHQLNISVPLMDKIANAFNELYQQGKLQQGNGVFDFGEFQIHI